MNTSPSRERRKIGLPKIRFCASGTEDLVLTHNALASRSPDRVEGNPILTNRELVHDLEDARPTFQPDELTNPKSVCHLSPRHFVEA
jgi:hypothetical protein